MKRNLLTLAAFGVITVGAYAASTGTIVIQGTVDASASIEITPVGKYKTLDLATDTTDEPVASVKEICNSLAGYTVTLSSKNAGTGTQAFLQGENKDNNLTPVVNYTMRYNGTVVDLTKPVTDVKGRTPIGGVSKDLKVSYSGNKELTADTYSDTLTLTITAK